MAAATQHSFVLGNVADGNATLVSDSHFVLELPASMLPQGLFQGDSVQLTLAKGETKLLRSTDETDLRAALYACVEELQKDEADLQARRLDACRKRVEQRKSGRLPAASLPGSAERGDRSAMPDSKAAAAAAKAKAAEAKRNEERRRHVREATERAKAAVAADSEGKLAEAVALYRAAYIGLETHIESFGRSDQKVLSKYIAQYRQREGILVDRIEEAERRAQEDKKRRQQELEERQKRERETLQKQNTDNSNVTEVNTQQPDVNKTDPSVPKDDDDSDNHMDNSQDVESLDAVNTVRVGARFALQFSVLQAAQDVFESLEEPDTQQVTDMTLLRTTIASNIVLGPFFQAVADSHPLESLAGGNQSSCSYDEFEDYVSQALQQLSCVPNADEIVS